MRRALTWAHYKDKIVPTLLATWAVWMPLMAVIYALSAQPDLNSGLGVWDTIGHFVAGRHGSPVDWAIDAGGVALAMLAVRRGRAQSRST